MANVTLVNTHIEKLVAEVARQYMTAERALSTPQANVSMTVGATQLTITAALPFNVSVENATGAIAQAFVDNTPAAVPVVGSSALSAVTVANLADALAAAIIKLDAAENTFIAAGNTLAAGLGASYSFSNGIATLTAVLPISVTIDGSGNQVITVTNYVS